MRDIKFRAWDKTINQMNYKVLVGNTDTNDPNYTCNSILIKEPPEDVKWMNADEYCIDLMQYTGLKDKNGKEIYDGDVLDLSGNYYVCEFYYGRFRIVNPKDKLQGLSHFENETQDYLEIIGNIYQDKHLLK